MSWRHITRYPCACSNCKDCHPNQLHRPPLHIDTIRRHLKNESKKLKLKGSHGYYVTWEPWGPLDREFVSLLSNDTDDTIDDTAKQSKFDVEAYYTANPHITKGHIFSSQCLTLPDGETFTLEILVQGLHRFLKKGEHSENVDLVDSINAVLTRLNKPNIKKGVKIPTSKWKFKRKIEKFSTPVLKFDVCPNDCGVIFDLSEQELLQCPNPDCRERRFDASGTPRKQIQYAPLIYRLQRWFGIRRISEYMRKQLEYVLKNDFETILDIRETPYFKSKFTQYKPNDEIPVAIRFMADGFRPFTFRQDTSFMLMAVTNLLLPPKLRNALGNFSVLSIYDEKHGGNKGKFQFYLQLFAAELMALKSGDIKIWDGYLEKVVPVRLFFFCSTADYSQHVHTLNCGSTNGNSGCIRCHAKRSVLSDIGCNVVTRFGDLRTFEEIANIRSEQKYNYLSRNKRFQEIRKDSGIGGQCVLEPLGRALDPYSNSFIDVMHATTNSLRRLFALIRNEYENVVNVSKKCKCRHSEVMKRVHVWSRRNGATLFTDWTRFRTTINLEARKRMDNELRMLLLPSHFDITTSAGIFYPEGENRSKFHYKFHNYFALARHNLIPTVLDIVKTTCELGISDEVAKTICNLFHLFDAMNRDALTTNEIDWVVTTAKTVYGQCLRHLDAPLFRTSFHLLFHIADELPKVGNLKSTSQFNFENKLGCFKRAIQCPPQPIVALFSRIQKLEFFGHIIVAKSFDVSKIPINEYEAEWSAASVLRPMIRNQKEDTFHYDQSRELVLTPNDEEAINHIGQNVNVKKIASVTKLIADRSFTYCTEHHALKNAHVALLKEANSILIAEPITLATIDGLYWVDEENVYAALKTIETQEFGELSKSRISSQVRARGPKIYEHLKRISEPLIVRRKNNGVTIFVNVRANRILPVDGVLDIHSNIDELEIQKISPLPACQCKKGRRNVTEPTLKQAKERQKANSQVSDDSDESEMSFESSEGYSDSENSIENDDEDRDEQQSTSAQIKRTVKRRNMPTVLNKPNASKRRKNTN